MNWTEAIEAMRRGCHVQRKSEQYRRLIRPGDPETGDLPIYECGVEACRLVAAWTDKDEPVMVFQGCGSKVMFCPDDEHEAATDWVVVFDPAGTAGGSDA